MSPHAPDVPPLPGWTPLSHGKVRDVYAPASTRAGERPDRLLMVTSDRISAFDSVLPTPVPDKGRILNQLSTWWMRRMADIVPHHLLDEAVPEAVTGRAVICRALDMVPVECVVRGHLTGSGWAEYRESGTLAGLPLRAALHDGSRLETPVFTPARKSPAGEHDENISVEEMARMIGPELAADLEEASLAIFTRARDLAAERGLVLVDTKFEFGLDTDGRLTLGDEVLTPDSSRFWLASEQREDGPAPSLDKQYLRDWLRSPSSGWDVDAGGDVPELPETVVAATRERYLELFRRLTGEEPDLG